MDGGALLQEQPFSISNRFVGDGKLRSNSCVLIASRAESRDKVCAAQSHNKFLLLLHCVARGNYMHALHPRNLLRVKRCVF